jgi:hypothetical protein
MQVVQLVHPVASAHIVAHISEHIVTSPPLQAHSSLQVGQTHPPSGVQDGGHIVLHSMLVPPLHTHSS